MKTSLKANLIKHLIAKKEEGGFTLIELLVVIIIIGILAAIALPSFLNQANKAKQSEAQTYIGSINRAQQAYYLETSAFSNNIPSLGLGIQTSTTNYDYDAVVDAPVGGTKNGVSNRAKPKLVNGQKSPLLAFVGGTYVGGLDSGIAGSSTETTTLAILCRAQQPPVRGGTDGVVEVTFPDSTTTTEATCPNTMNKV